MTKPIYLPITFMDMARISCIITNGPTVVTTINGLTLHLIEQIRVAKIWADYPDIYRDIIWNW